MEKVINRLVKTVLSLIRYRENRYFSRIRILFLRRLGAIIGERVTIKSGVIIEYPENISIGDNVSIQQSCFISAYAPIKIENDVSLGHGVSIITTTHPYDVKGIIREQPLVSAEVHIKRNCWIGMKASILHGVTIESGVVVAAHAVVNNSVAENCVVGGLPAKVLKSRAVTN